MRLLKIIVASIFLFMSAGVARAQVSSENLVNIHTLTATEISALVSPAKGALVFNSDSNKLYVFDGTVWMATASLDTSSLSNRINQRVKYTDTGAMLIGYVRKADTAAMLLPYASKANLRDSSLLLRGLISSSIVDTASLSNRIDQRVKYTDTAAMLNPYLKEIDTTSFLAKYLTQNGDKIFGTTSGTATAYTLTLSPAITSYVAGQVFNVQFHLANTGASTISINGLGAKSLVKYVSTPLVANDILLNSQYQLLYDGTNFLIKDIGLKGINTSAALAGQISNETGTGVVTFATSPTFTTSVLGGSTFAAFNTATTTLSLGGAATTMTVGGTPTSAVTHNYSANATATGVTKTINLGTGGVSGSTTAINIGSAVSGATNNVSINNLSSGALTDSVVVVNSATGLLRRISSGRISGSVDTSSLSARIEQRVQYTDTAAMLTNYATKANLKDTATVLRGLISSSVVDTSSLSARIEQRVKYTDTAAMLTNYATKANLKDTATVLRGLISSSVVDTSSLSSRIEQRVKYTDTAAMLLPYARTTKVLLDSNALAANINARVKYTDTAAMLNNYATKANLKDTATVLRGLITSSIVDTSSLSTRIDQRVKYTDTATMLANYLNSASNGLTRSGKTVQLGGTLTSATTIANSGANTLRISGMASGDLNDSLVVADATTGELFRISSSRLTRADSTTASNGLTLTGKDVRLGGSLTAATSITATAANTLAVSGLQSGSANDSLVASDPSTGVLKRVSATRLNKVDSTTASNGLTLSGKDVRLGGTLTSATTITNSGANTLRISGLASGDLNDSLVVADPTTGELLRVSSARLSKVDSTTASNGLTLTAKDVRLGGNLTAATTVTTTATNTLAIAGLQTSSLNDSVLMISSGNVVRRINSSSVALEPFNVVGGTTKASTNTQDIYTQGNLSVGKTTNAATLDVGGKVKADSTISAPNFSSTYQNFGSAGGTITWNMQSGATAGITLTSNGTISISNVTAGMYGLIRVTQDGTGGRTLTLPSGSRVINSGGSATVVLTQTANAVDILTFFYDGTNYWWTIGNNY